MDAKETLTRIVLLALLLYAAACFASSKRELYAAAAIERALSGELEAIEKDNFAVRSKLTEGWNEEEIEALARKRLGLVRPGDRIFCFVSDTRERDSRERETDPAAPDQERRETERIIHGLASR